MISRRGTKHEKLYKGRDRGFVFRLPHHYDEVEELFLPPTWG